MVVSAQQALYFEAAHEFAGGSKAAINQMNVTVTKEMVKFLLQERIVCTSKNDGFCVVGQDW